ncbi:DoxX family protein [Actinomycetospora lemnae]|uniref:DoxX family membrane protein n=1 Tax=Actinomycetospora lemnae TaxID=3019891 RepID=A0ABT5T1C3_9PSEU|nr:hypothetical protein [Actinomycetospora sp. DW7H6]MDD7968924.1 hypothetical protein [Actinomycetospora sp. DW7H6]
MSTSSRVGAVLRTVARVVLGLALIGAGTAHLTVARVAFRAQVPSWFPADADLVVLVSGVVEIVLGLALLVLARRRVVVGLVVAAFFVVIFPGNIAQFVEQRPAFGLGTDRERGVRLLYQPVLVAWALWSTGAWGPLVAWFRRRRPG